MNMFNGIIYFMKTPNGYVVNDAMESPFGDYKNIITTLYAWHKIVRIEGSFNFTPKRGKFCKRPHKCIVWC